MLPSINRYQQKSIDRMKVMWELEDQIQEVSKKILNAEEQLQSSVWEEEMPEIQD